MIGDISVFDKVVKTEDSYTQVLCNLMILDGEFRTQILSKLLNAKLAPTVTGRDIRTQVILEKSGRPDVEIQTPNLYALIEVKLDPGRGCTLPQDPANDSAGYLHYLLSDKIWQSERWLVYLLPSDSEHLSAISEKVNEAKKSHPKIKCEIVFWSQILKILQNENLTTHRIVLGEFQKLLVSRFGPVRFSTEDTKMLFSRDVPIRAIRKLDYVIEQIAQHSKDKYNACRTKPNGDKDGEEHGLNFKTTDGKDLLWFGVWTSFWEQKGFPLCFGIDSRWSMTVPKLPEAFSGSCKSMLVQFEGWSVAWIPEEVLEKDDPVEAIWAQLEPILRNVYSAAR